MRSKVKQIVIIVIVDIAIVTFSAIVPLILRFGIFDIDSTYLNLALRFLPIDICIAIVILTLFKLYTRIWSFAGFSELIAVFQASIIIQAIYIMYHIVFDIDLPRSFYPIQWVFLLILLGGSRISVRFYRQIMKRNRTAKEFTSIIVVGAGSAGSTLANEINYQNTDRRVVCFVDDNKSKKNKYLNGILIAGSRYDIPELVDKYLAEEIILAIPGARPSDMHDIIKICGSTPARLKILPGITKNMTESLSKNVRNVNYEDLLGRNTVEIDNEHLSEFLSGKTVLITGAGGSIGSELCRQILANRPKKLIMLDIYENNLFDLSEELKRRFPDADFESLIASVRDEKRISEIFENYLPQIVYHAAAHKHVPLMEDSPCEAVKNNCGGTYITAMMADKYKAEHFILISTDKAVRPTSVMGATKHICEMIVQTINKTSETRYVSVRFGNVLGSSGSVVPLFLRQIEEGGPVVVTHKDVTRFFMTITEAVSLVLQAGIPNGKGELFILDMGEPVKIYDLAVNLIKIKGLVPCKDIKIEFSGLRPGEKLYEELLACEEGLESTPNDLIFVGKPANIDTDMFVNGLHGLLTLAESNSDYIKDEIVKICDTYLQT